MLPISCCSSQALLIHGNPFPQRVLPAESVLLLRFYPEEKLPQPSSSVSCKRPCSAPQDDGAHHAGFSVLHAQAAPSCIPQKNISPSSFSCFHDLLAAQPRDCMGWLGWKGLRKSSSSNPRLHNFDLHFFKLFSQLLLVLALLK